MYHVSSFSFASINRMVDVFGYHPCRALGRRLGTQAYAYRRSHWHGGELLGYKHSDRLLLTL